MTPERAFGEMVQALMRSMKGYVADARLSVGKVKEVNLAEGSCDVERDGSPDLYDVRLNAVIDEGITDKFTVVPAVGSLVMVMSLGEATEAMVVATSKIEKVVIQTGEISVRAEKITLLAKSLLPLPEKFHGMTDTDLRYRQRYIDLIMNADVKKTFINRSKIIASIRSYLNGQNFLEVETPMLVANAGGAAARPFETHFNALDEDFKLRISLELYLKVYEIGRVFRNEGLDTRHNPEFTLMELYQAYTDYHGMMDLTENLYRHVAKEVLGTTTIVYNGIEMDLGKPFERIQWLTLLKSTQALTLTKLIHLKRLVRLPMNITLNMRTDIRRAIFLTCSLKNMQRNTLFNRLSLWIIRLKFHRLQRKSLKTLITLNVLSSL